MIDIEAIRKRIAAATPGIWIVRKMRGEEDRIGHGFVQAPRLDPSHGYDIEILCEDANYPDERREGDLQFIAAARQDIPALLAENAAQAERIKELEAERDGWKVQAANLAETVNGISDRCDEAEAALKKSEESAAPENPEARP